MSGLVAAQRDRRTEQPKLQWIAADRRANEGQLGTFNETENHQALDRGVLGVDGFDGCRFARRKFAQRQRVDPNANDSRYCIAALPAGNGKTQSNGWRRIMMASRPGPVETISTGMPSSVSSRAR